MPLSFSFRVDASEFLGFTHRLADGLEAGLENPEVLSGFDTADQACIAEQQQRFNAEGAGEWPELSESTQRERKRQGYGPAHPILRRKGVLFAALIRGSAGNFHEVSRNAIESGFGGGDVHPGYGDESVNATISQIAAIHQHGGGRVPARPILNKPSDELLARMSESITDGYRKLIAAAIQPQ